MGIRHLQLLLCIVIMRSSTFLAEASGEQETIYDVLRRNGLPIGLIPKVVKSYTLHDSGVFEVNLDKPCYTKFENPVYYDTLIKGNLSYGQIAGLSGVQAKELFLWFPVKVIRVDIPSTGFIYFDVGVIYKQLSISLFENPPDCHDNISYVPRTALQ